MGVIEDEMRRCFGENIEIHVFTQQTTKRIKKQKEDRLPNGDEPGILKKNAWIVWLSDELQYITDLQVYELDENVPDRWAKTVDFIDRKVKEMGNRSYRDCGRVNSDWEKWTLESLLFKFGCQYGFVDRDTMVKCMERLGTIIEFKMAVDSYLKFIK